MATDQLEVAALSAADARSIAAGEGRFAPYGATPLRLIAALERHWLVARAGFPQRHAWLTRAAMVETGPARSAGAWAFPKHPGAAAFDLGVALERLPEVGEG